MKMNNIVLIKMDKGIFYKITAFVVLIMFLSSCSKKLTEGMIIFTQVSETEPGAKKITDTLFKNTAESHILAINTDQAQKEPLNLTNDFYSACSPEVSYDGKFMIFTAQKERTGTWQIWEMNLSNLKARQITDFTENCVNPAYLPRGQFVFSKLTESDGNAKVGNSLFTGNIDGSEIHQITFNPHIYSESNVLHDGRILTISQQIYPDSGEKKFMVLRPDGTKQELFYQSIEERELVSKGREIEDGKIVFIEIEGESDENGNIFSINYNRPLNSCANLTSQLKGSFRSVSPLQLGSLLVAYRPEGKNNYALYSFSPENKTPSIIYEKKGFSILEAVVIEKRERPRKLPSEVNMGVKTGLLMCQDINFLGIESIVNKLTDIRAEKIEVLGVDSTLGLVNVEKDGSFYLKILADTPFRLRTLSSDGELVNGPGSWIYLRPNERRGCVGCHAGNEQSPFNVQPLSVKKEPVVIPQEIKGIFEHEVELE